MKTPFCLNLGKFFFKLSIPPGLKNTKITAAHGTGPLWVGLPVILVILLGGLTTNFLWCSYLIIRNRTAGELTGRAGAAPDADGQRPNLRVNYLLAALGGKRVVDRVAIGARATLPPPALREPSGGHHLFDRRGEIGGDARPLRRAPRVAVRATSASR